MTNFDIERLLQIGIALSKEKDHNRLLEIILTEAMNITNCDAGTLYLCSDGRLYFRIMYNHTMRVYSNNAESISLPPVAMDRKNVCACAAIDHTLINIADVRKSGEYDFSGPIRYDAMTGYYTESMLVIPLEDNYGDIIGVLQLINAQTETGATIPFDPKFEMVISSLASQAAVCITNRRYISDIKGLFHSFVHVISTAVDQRTPYNANHTRNMAIYAERFIAFLNRQHEAGLTARCFAANREDQFVMSVFLHDIGKLLIPLEIMDKDTRLGTLLPQVLRRFDVISLQAQIEQLSGRMESSVREKLESDLNEAKALVERLNHGAFLTDEAEALLKVLVERRFVDTDGQEKCWLNEQEFECLQIRKGTLTAEERRIMEGHVEYTRKILKEIKFSPEYSDVPRWAEDHHEFLNGSGYPKRLRDRQIDFETRLLTVIDIYDALTAQDRPYRRSMSAEKALSVLDEMVDEGKLDGETVQLFRESHAWEVISC